MRPPRLLAVDVVAKVFSMVPAPYLQPAFESFRTILSQIEQVQTNKRQIQTIAETVAQILFSLNSRSSEISAEDPWILKNRLECEGLLSRITDFCAKHSRRKPLRSFLEASEVQAEINLIHAQLSLSVDSLHISSQINTQNYHRRAETARQQDQAEINISLKQLHKSQDTLLALVGRPTEDNSCLRQSEPRVHESTESHKTIFGLLGDIQETVQSPIDKKNDELLKEVLFELRKFSSTPARLLSADPNPIDANLKPGLVANVLIAPLRWKMNVYMRNDQLTQHLHHEDIWRFAKGAEGSKLFVEYLTTTDDRSLQYSALEIFRQDKAVKHFFRPV